MKEHKDVECKGDRCGDGDGDCCGDGDEKYDGPPCYKENHSPVFSKSSFSISHLASE